MQRWLTILSFCLLCLVTAVALFYSAVYAGLARTFAYDYNFEIMAHVLTPEQASHVTATVATLVGICVWPIFFTNLLWIVAFVVVWSKLPPRAAPPA